MINGFYVYYTFTAIKNHFYTKKYDYWKFNKRLSKNINEDTFNNRRDRSFFFVVGKKFNDKRDLENFFISNFKNDVNYITDMVNDNSMKIYGTHMKIIDALSRNIESNINVVIEKKENNKNYIISGQILKDVRQNIILIETLCFFDLFFDIFSLYNKINDTMYKEKEQLFYNKYVIYLRNTVEKTILAKLSGIYFNNFIRRN